MPDDKRGFLYILRCTDNSLYTGITTDPKRRITEHRNKNQKCAKYMRGHTLLCVEALFSFNDMRTAASVEYKIKQLKKSDKERLLSGDFYPDFLVDAVREKTDGIL
ncbi:MAG: GIY-YIG nuclease family protein [Eubacteriales bacterium]|nr:GIY-YIG nuclease family protein [Eubacteriales bacterium]